jgi:DNA-binding Lrp family transcriptional regulator
LSPSAVRRRIARLEGSGVIARYTVVLDPGKIDEARVEAYVDVDLASGSDVDDFMRRVVKAPQVREAAMTPGDPDAVLRVRVGSVDELRDAMAEIRRQGPVVSCKAHIVLATFRDGSGGAPRPRA